jgi:YihY family inner membrane protein
MSRFKLFRLIGQFIPLGFFRKVIEFLSHYFGGIARKTDEHHIFLSGAGIAFSLIISLVPFILLVFAILGNIINPETVETQITRAIDTIIPYPEYAKYTKEAILKRIPAVIEYKTIAGYIGAFGLFFTSTWLFSSLRTVLNNVYGSADQKGALHGLLRDFGMVLLLVVFVLLSTIILPIVNVLFDAAEKVEVLKSIRISELTDSLLSLVSVLIIFLMFFTFYKLIPYAKLGKRIPLVSAFLGNSIVGNSPTNFWILRI